jgi:hypothetical protein
MSATVAPGDACANCGEALNGVYCHGCGQKAASPNVSLHEFFHEAFHEFAHLDGKIVSTLKLLLTKPGQLTKEFLEGRRSRYISPLRTYLTCSLLFFALAAVAPQADRPFFHVTKVTAHDEQFDPETRARMLEEATEKANHALVHNFPRAMFVLMPVFGLLTWVLYRKSRRFYAAHLYYAVHFHAFVFLALSASIPLRLVFGKTGLSLVMLLISVYHFASLRRVFGGSRLQTAWKGSALYVTYLVLIFAAVIGIGVASIQGLAPSTPGAPSESTSRSSAASRTSAVRS